MKINLTVLFNDPFWIGVFEVIKNDEYKVCKITFGPEPREEETPLAKISSYSFICYIRR